MVTGFGFHYRCVRGVRLELECAYSFSESSGSSGVLGLHGDTGCCVVLSEK